MSHTECTLVHESTAITDPGWKRTYEPIRCAHFDGQTAVLYAAEPDGGPLVTIYRDGKPGSITQPADDVAVDGRSLTPSEAFDWICESWLLGGAK